MRVTYDNTGKEGDTGEELDTEIQAKLCAVNDEQSGKSEKETKKMCKSKESDDGILQNGDVTDVTRNDVTTKPGEREPEESEHAEDAASDDTGGLSSDGEDAGSISSLQEKLKKMNISHVTASLIDSDADVITNGLADIKIDDQPSKDEEKAAVESDEEENETKDEKTKDDKSQVLPAGDKDEKDAAEDKDEESGKVAEEGKVEERGLRVKDEREGGKEDADYPRRRLTPLGPVGGLAVMYGTQTRSNIPGPARQELVFTPSAPQHNYSCGPTRKRGADDCDPQGSKYRFPEEHDDQLCVSTSSSLNTMTSGYDTMTSQDINITSSLHHLSGGMTFEGLTEEISFNSGDLKELIATYTVTDDKSLSNLIIDDVTQEVSQLKAQPLTFPDPVRVSSPQQRVPGGPCQVGCTTDMYLGNNGTVKPQYLGKAPVNPGQYTLNSGTCTYPNTPSTVTSLAPSPRYDNLSSSLGNQAMSPSNHSMSPGYQATSPGNQVMANQALYEYGSFNQSMAFQSPNNQALSPSNQGMSLNNQALSPSNQVMSPNNQAMSPSNQGMSPSNQGISPNHQANHPTMSHSNQNHQVVSSFAGQGTMSPPRHFFPPSPQQNPPVYGPTPSPGQPGPSPGSPASANIPSPSASESTTDDMLDIITEYIKDDTSTSTGVSPTEEVKPFTAPQLSPQTGYPATFPKQEVSGSFGNAPDIKVNVPPRVLPPVGKKQPDVKPVINNIPASTTIVTMATNMLHMPPVTAGMQQPITLVPVVTGNPALSAPAPIVLIMTGGPQPPKKKEPVPIRPKPSPGPSPVPPDTAATKKRGKTKTDKLQSAETTKPGQGQSAGASKGPQSACANQTSRRTHESFRASRQVAMMTPEQLLWRDPNDHDSLLHVVIVREDFFRFEALIKRLHRDQLLSQILNSVNDRNQTPLYLGTVLNQTEMVEKLIQHGADVNIEASQTGQASQGVRRACPLHSASSKGSVFLPTVRALLRAPGVEVNRCNSDGQTALHLAIQAHDTRHRDSNTPLDSREIITALVQNGLDLNKGDLKSGKTPIHYAIEKRDVMLVQHLMTLAGANLLPTLLRSRTFDGNTSLHYAVGLTGMDVEKQVQLCLLLMNGGADPTEQNQSRQLPKNLTKNPRILQIIQGKLL